MERDLIEKIINNIINKNIQTKCSKSDLTRADKEFIEAFVNSDEEWLDDEENEQDIAWQKYEEIQLKHNYTERHSSAVVYWGTDGYKYMNGKIYSTDYFKGAIEKGIINHSLLDAQIKDLEDAIDNGMRVPFNVISHRYGHWDSGLNTGDVVVNKGFASTGLDGSLNLRGDGYEITYYVPTDTRGILVTEEQFYGVVPGEQELLLGRGIRQYVLEQDDINATVSVLVLPDR